MTTYDFILTKKLPGRFYRHIIFWVVQYLFWTFWATTFFIGFTESLKFGFQFNGAFILHAVYTYSVVYFFSPKYRETGQYVKFGIILLILTLVVYVLYVFYLLWFFYGFDRFFREFRAPSDQQQLLMSWYFSMNFISSGPPAICALFLTFKMMKNYYLKVEEKKILIQENARAELQLLKAQVHPHFLFNTLNNIYSFALHKSAKAFEMILQLSDMMKYMIHDCATEFVPLDKELKMIDDYISLEKVRYGNRLDIKTDIEGEFDHKLISPLFMISFVENSFKHGASKMLNDPWIKLFIQADETVLHFTLSNSKPLDVIKNGKCGIGLSNVKKRLELLYPQNHLLLVEETANTFTVNMQVPIFSDRETMAK